MRAFVVAVLVLLVAAAPADALEPGGTDFWTEREHVLEVKPGAWRLRVALDKHTVADSWRAEVQGPNGTATIDVPTGLYSGEAFIERPDPGRWTVRIVEAGETDQRFRMRAKLEREPVDPSPAVAELPNLQAMPPWDFTFQYPLTNGTTDPPQGILMPGGRLACHSEEAMEGAVRCLRMAFGVRNTGRGPMDLKLGPGGETQDRALIQQVHHSDGTISERAAGLARFHASHGHFHHDAAIGLELLALGTDGSLTPAADLHLKGFAHRNEALREWRMFHPTWDMDGFGLTAGWGDYYEWDRPGNYADFGFNGDGRYVLRLTADPVGGILESNEADNVGYSVVDVTGTDVKLLESGRGTGPGDRCRILMPLGPEPELPAGMVQPPRPADCALDSVDPDPGPVIAPPPVATAAPAVQPSPPAVKEKPAAKKKKRAKAKRCPKLRRGMSRKRRAAVRRCQRAAKKRAQLRRRESGKG